MSFLILISQYCILIEVQHYIFFFKNILSREAMSNLSLNAYCAQYLQNIIDNISLIVLWFVRFTYLSIFKQKYCLNLFSLDFSLIALMSFEPK